ncbi:MAG: Rossmann-like and DUF2520 domain-containing protein [Gemmatimonadota bacterium]
MTLGRVAVVGPGRVGLSLARALTDAGTEVTLLGRQASVLPGHLGRVETSWQAGVAAATLVVIAVPDDAIEGVAASLAATSAVTPAHVVLHTSGLHGRSSLAALEPTGAALGSWHPLQTFSSTHGDPASLAGSPAVIEGDARALDAGRSLAVLLALHPVVELPASGKAVYHAAAVFASNYLVVLGEIAARLAREAGAGGASQALFAPLMERTIANFGASGADALTGPIRRGDIGTIERHLAVLHGEEREVYLVMGKAALRLARASGLDDVTARRIEQLFGATAR